ncbi:hypothetical protein [Plasmodium yoelii yoelii]|uniref:Uncharacterized protein n=1 Tax=Plasmodium yoelii yoelii TaxID=73239 RepID=Q7RSI2_PLAYO|nr:hypothetical protein [Plasmodium yoelii yoelii]
MFPKFNIFRYLFMDTILYTY